MPPTPPPHPQLCRGFRPADAEVRALCRWMATLSYSISFLTLYLAQSLPASPLILQEAKEKFTESPDLAETRPWESYVTVGLW